MESENLYRETTDLMLRELRAALERIDPEQVDRLIELVEQSEQVFFVGVGRVMLSLEAIAKRWAHLGVKTHIVGEITEPAITERDLLIVGSGSGTTLFPAAIAQKAHSVGAKVVHIGSNPNSGLRDIAACMVRIPVRTKNYLADEMDSQQPMTSLFEQSLLLLGDAAAMMMIKRRGLELRALWRHHANLE